MGLNQQSCQVKKKPPSALHPSPPFSTASMRSRRRTTHSPRASSPRFSASTPASSSSSVTAKPKAPWTRHSPLTSSPQRNVTLSRHTVHGGLQMTNGTLIYKYFEKRLGNNGTRANGLRGGCELGTFRSR